MWAKVLNDPSSLKTLEKPTSGLAAWQISTKIRSTSLVIHFRLVKAKNNAVFGFKYLDVRQRVLSCSSEKPNRVQTCDSSVKQLRTPLGDNLIFYLQFQSVVFHDYFPHFIA